MIARRRCTLKHEQGYSLIELLAYLVVLGIIINVSAPLFLSAMRLSKVGEAASDNLKGVEEIRSRISDRVREAVRVVPSTLAFESGEDQLILEMPDAPIARRVVFGTLNHPNQVSRLELIQKDGQWVPDFLATYRQSITGLRFSYDTADPSDAALIQFVVEIDNKGMTNTIPAENLFAVALRSRRSSR